jgi:hypothetical protein
MYPSKGKALLKDALTEIGITLVGILACPIVILIVT